MQPEAGGARRANLFREEPRGYRAAELGSTRVYNLVALARHMALAGESLELALKLKLEVELEMELERPLAR
ncbi:hypothetical protein AWZ03_004343 [Drosophila navojoa]|uniref:Uncharacterized protein n=1 Tax=Drosophila navojoa TaxID=7232 RepID=A0A484BKR0_DRONA|nr:hypothetical protein AWZ03_004343 [Drosophila navojoa]